MLRRGADRSRACSMRFAALRDVSFDGAMRPTSPGSTRADARPRRFRPRRVSAQPASAAGDRRAAHGRHPRSASTPATIAAPERRPAGDARRRDRRVRQSLFQAQARRRRRGRHRATRADRRGARPAAAGIAVTLDGNEQFADVAAVVAIPGARSARPARSLASPPSRSISSSRCRARRRSPPTSRRSPDAAAADRRIRRDARRFPAGARAAATRGVSSKSCKGFYKSLLNAARCARGTRAGRRARFHVRRRPDRAGRACRSAGSARSSALLGLTHVERNGHHYVDGFAGQHAPAREQEAFLAAHPDLYARRRQCAPGDPRRNDRLDSLDRPGFARARSPTGRR